MSLADRNWVLDARLITSRRQRDAGLSLSGSRRVFARRGFRFRPIPPAGIKVPVENYGLVTFDVDEGVREALFFVRVGGRSGRLGAFTPAVGSEDEKSSPSSVSSCSASGMLGPRLCFIATGFHA